MFRGMAGERISAIFVPKSKSATKGKTMARLTSWNAYRLARGVKRKQFRNPYFWRLVWRIFR